MMGADDGSTPEQIERRKRELRAVEGVRKLKNACKKQEEYTLIERVSDIAHELDAMGKVSLNRFERAVDNCELGGLVDIVLPSGLWWKNWSGPRNLGRFMGRLESETELKFGLGGDFNTFLLSYVSFNYVKHWEEVLIGRYVKVDEDEFVFKKGPFFSNDYDKREEFELDQFPRSKEGFKRTKGVTAGFALYRRKGGNILPGVTLEIYDPTFKDSKFRRKNNKHFIEGSTRMKISSDSGYQMLSVADMLLTYKYSYKG